MIPTPEALEALRGRLIVSCQPYPGEPMRDPRTTGRVAASAVMGGAAAIRVQGLADVQYTRTAVEVAVIGLWKDGHDGVFITPILRHALALANAGAHVVAVDGTRRARPDGLTLSGYSGERPRTTGQDLGLLEQIAAAGFGAPLIAEGRIHSPGQAKQPLDAGAFAGVVGTAVTITGWFAEALK